MDKVDGKNYLRTHTAASNAGTASQDEEMVLREPNAARGRFRARVSEAV